MSHIEFIYILFANLAWPLLVYSNETESDVLLRHQYYLVVDAGMIQTIAYVIVVKHHSQNRLKAESLFSRGIVPGIGHYAENPEKCIGPLSDLITEAKVVIPESELSQTGLIFVATGLELLHPFQRRTLLKYIREYVNATGLRVDESTVSEMDGRKKLFNWLTVNFLLDNFQGTNPNETASIIDLGSGAVSQAYAPASVQKLKLWQKALLTKMDIFNTSYKVFGYSIYELGISKARIKILEMGRINKTEKHQSPCIHRKTITTWWLENRKFKIEGMPSNHNKSVNLTECVRAVRAVVTQYKSGPSLYNTTVYALSFFYHGLMHLGLFPEGQPITQTVKEIKVKVREACHSFSHKHPFVCMDTVFIVVLLKRIFGLKDDSVVHFVTSLTEQKVNWVLGAAFNQYLREVNLESDSENEIPNA